MKPIVLLVAAAIGGLAASHPVSPASAAPTVSLSATHRIGLQEPDARALFSENCKKCHGVLGNPPVTMKKKYEKIATFDAKFLERHSEDSIVKVLTKGKSEDMKSFADVMSPAELHAVAKYVRELASKAKPAGTP